MANVEINLSTEELLRKKELSEEQDDEEKPFWDRDWDGLTEIRIK